MRRISPAAVASLWLPIGCHVVKTGGKHWSDFRLFRSNFVFNEVLNTLFWLFRSERKYPS